jgi:hypothetical protein
MNKFAKVIGLLLMFLGIGISINGDSVMGILTTICGVLIDLPNEINRDHKVVLIIHSPEGVVEPVTTLNTCKTQNP